MSTEDPFYEQIELYLNGSMDAKAKADFEDRLQNDEALAAQFALYAKVDGIYNEEKWNINVTPTLEEEKELAALYRSDEIKTLSTKIDNAKTAYDKSNTVVRRRKGYTRYLTAIASVAALFVLCYFTFFNQLGPTDAFETYHDWSTLPSLQTKSDVSNTLTKANELFQAKNYKEALHYFNAYTTEIGEYNPKIQLHIGVCELETNNYTEAVNIFTELSKSNTIDANKGYWYLALTYLKQENTEKAIATLNELLKSERNFNYAKAKKLLKDLK